MYQGPPDRVVGWFLAFNAINYSFWPEPGKKAWHTEIDGKLYGVDDEAFGIMAAFTHAMTHGVALDNPAVLVALDAAELERILLPASNADSLPMMATRLDALHELGEALERHGGPLGLLETGRGSAPELVQSLARELPSWQDSRIYNGQRMRFLKRAQLCVAMLYGRFGGKPPCNFRQIETLSAFADYRLPQILRSTGILELSQSVAARIENRENFLQGSSEEIQLRCATIVAVDRIRETLSQQWPGITALQIDYLLWKSAVNQADALPEFHRTRCTDY